MPAHDPWLWTTEDLTNALCHSIALFQAAGCTVADLPSPAALEHQIRSQNMTGATFLSSLDIHALRTARDMNHAGQRVSLHPVVELLRTRSGGYQRHLATTGVSSLNLNNASRSAEENTPCATVAVDGDNRKRRKIAHIATTPVPTKSSDSLIPSTAAPPSAAKEFSQANHDCGTWDHLLHWQNLAGDEHDEYADEGDDSEGEQEQHLAGAVESDDEDALEDEEQPATVHGRNKLSSDEVLDIINERIEHYTKAWTPNKRVSKDDMVSYDPQAMWEEAEAAGERQQLAEKHEEERSYYNYRLDQLCDEIMKFPASTPEGVRRQCGNLEVTIESMELAEWLASIYRLEPESGNEDEPDDQRSVGQPAIPAVNLSHASGETQYDGEFIDLDSPPSSSFDDTEEPERLSICNETRIGTQTDQLELQGRYRTSDSVIAETVEEHLDDSLLPTLLGGVKALIQYGDVPEHASIATVRRWEWVDLIDSLDRKRVVSKAVAQLKSQDCDVIRSRLRDVGTSSLIREVRACLKMISHGETNLQGVLPRDQAKIETFTRLFMSWWFCDNYMDKSPPRCRVKELQSCLLDGCNDLSTFFTFLGTIMTTTFSEEALRHPEQPSQAEIIEISDDEDG